MKRSLGLLALVSFFACNPPPGGGEIVSPHAIASAPPRAPACPGAAPPAAPASPHQILDAAHTASVDAMALSSNGRLATRANDGTLRIWDARTRALLLVHYGDDVGSRTIAWDPAGEHVAILAANGGATLLGLDGQVAKKGANGVLPLATLSGEGGAQLLANQYDNLVALDPDLAQSFQFAPPADAGRVQTMGGSMMNYAATSEDGRIVAAAFEKGIATWQVAAKGKDAAFIALPATPIAVAVSAAGKLVIAAAGGPNNTMRTFIAPLAGGTARELPKFGEGSPRDVSISPDGAIAVGAAIDAIAAWDVASGKILWTRELKEWSHRPTFGQFPDFFTSVRIARDGRTIVASTGGGAVFQIALRTGVDLGEYGSIVRAPTRLDFASADRILATSNDHVTEWAWKDGSVARHATSDLVTPAILPPTAISEDRLLLALPGGMMAQCPAGAASLIVQTWSAFVPPDPPKPVQASGSGLNTWVNQGPWWARLSVSTSWPPKDDNAVYCLGDSTGVVALDAPRSRLMGYRARIPGKPGQPVYVLDLAANKVVSLANAEDIPALGHAFSQGGGYVTAITNMPSKEAVWDARSGDLVARDLMVTNTTGDLIQMTMGGVNDAAVSPDDHTLALAYQNIVELYDLPSGKKSSRVDVKAYVGKLAFSSDSKTVFVGTSEGDLVAFGAVNATAKGGGGPVLAVSASPAGDVVATVHADGAIRIWDAHAPKLRAALASFADDEYLATTPGGAYAGTTEVADRVGWVFDAPVERFSFEQFSAAFHDEALLKQRLTGAAADASLPVARPPAVGFVEAPATSVAAGTTHIHVHASSGQRVDVIRAFVEGRPVAEKAVCAASGDADLELPLLPGQNRVSVVAFDAQGFASNAGVADVVDTRTDGAKPDLWIVGVGVGNYPHGLELHGTVNDVTVLSKTFSAMQGGLYEHAHVSTLIDDQASPAAIRAAIAGLSQMKPNDVGIVFFAGHGARRTSGEMVFVTNGIEVSKRGAITVASLDRASVGWNDLGAALAKVPGRVVVMLDACHSGALANGTVPNEALADGLVREQRAGTVVFAASKGRQYSLEGGPDASLAIGRSLVLEPAAIQSVQPFPSEDHGYFTGALLTSLADPGTDLNADGVLEFSEIVSEVTRRVTLVTHGQQTPWIARRDLFGDFTLARAAKGPR